MVVQKAQSAIEFITAYSWAFLLILIVGFVAFYYITSQQPAPQCSFGNGLQCLSYQFVKNNSGTMRLTFMMNNGMGKAVSFNDKQIITVTNIGKSGVNNYIGSCWGGGSIIREGDTIYCTFNITDSDVIPSLNRNVKFDVALSYVDCETSPDYPLDCYGGLNRTYRGAITAPFEARPSGVASFCGDGTCDLAHGESCSSCALDCGPCLSPSCQSNCTFGGMGLPFLCNLSCLGINGCASFLQACNGYTGYRCSDSAGGTTGALNYKIQCCNNGLSPALNCYQITPTTVGYCGNGVCDLAHENCTTCPQECGPCPSTCLLDCTMGDNTCHKSCFESGKCWGFNSVCDGWANGSLRCSDATGGPSGSLDNYSVCCTGARGPAPHCYQNTSKTIGYCGDNNCAASRGETCSSCPQDCGACPVGCQPDCTFGGKCNQSCAGVNGCAGFRAVCDKQINPSQRCSDLTGAIVGTTNYTDCCNGAVHPASSCYQMTQTTVGYCGDFKCDASNGENTFTCPDDCCRSDCGSWTLAGGSDSKCHAECINHNLCSSVLQACDTQLISSQNCSNSTGGTGGITNYNVSCCSNNGQPLASCGSNSTCPHTTAWCNNSNTQNCSADAVIACNFSCSGGVCGTSCAPTCTQICTPCPGSTTCQPITGSCVPAGCQPDCTFGDGICHASCAGTCLNFRPICDTLTRGTYLCSNSTGGATPPLNYIARCCNFTLTNCSNTSYCNGLPFCTGCPAGLANCNNDSADQCEVNLNTDNNNCGSCGHACGPCQVCSAGFCTSMTTNWGANLYGCAGASNRCYNGSCVSCGGFLSSDGCSGCAGQGGNGCWYMERGSNCTTGCLIHGGCVVANWNDTAACTIANALAPGCMCIPTGIPQPHAPIATSIGSGFCYPRTYTTSQDCNKSYGQVRFCVCQY